MRSRSGGGGFGLLGLVIVVAIVAWLALKAFGTTQHTARQVETVQRGDVSSDPNSGTSSAGNNTGALPNLSEMKANTSAHSGELASAAQESNQ